METKGKDNQEQIDNATQIVGADYVEQITRLNHMIEIHTKAGDKSMVKQYSHMKQEFVDKLHTLLGIKSKRRFVDIYGATIDINQIIELCEPMIHKTFGGWIYVQFEYVDQPSGKYNTVVAWKGDANYGPKEFDGLSKEDHEVCQYEFGKLKMQVANLKQLLIENAEFHNIFE